MAFSALAAATMAMAMARDCDEPSDEPAEAAVALVLAEQRPALLLLRRARHPADPWAGHWCLPGGRIEAADRDAAAAARRELAEECGVELADRSPDAILPRRLAGRAVGRSLVVAPFLWRLPMALPLRPDPVEVDIARWVPLEQLRDPGRRGEAELAPGRPGQRYAFVELEGSPLWGFTLAVLEAWLADERSG